MLVTFLLVFSDLWTLEMIVQFFSLSAGLFILILLKHLKKHYSDTTAFVLALPHKI